MNDFEKYLKDNKNKNKIIKREYRIFSRNFKNKTIEDFFSINNIKNNDYIYSFDLKIKHILNKYENVNVSETIHALKNIYFTKALKEEKIKEYKEIPPLFFLNLSLNIIKNNEKTIEDLIIFFDDNFYLFEEHYFLLEFRKTLGQKILYNSIKKDLNLVANTTQRKRVKI